MCFCVSFVLFIIYLFTYLLTYFAVYCISWICGYGELIKFGKFSAVHYFLQILFWLPFSYFFWDSNYVYARPLDTIIKVTYWETLFWDSQYSLREFLLYFVCSWFSIFCLFFGSVYGKVFRSCISPPSLGSAQDVETAIYWDLVLFHTYLSFLIHKIGN